MTSGSIKVSNVAEAYLRLLAQRGIEYLFANAGTDFAPMIEAMADISAKGAAAPTPIIATHETVAMSMAHGYAMVSGKLPAVMLHVSVGTANGWCGAFNAARENVPILFTAGRSPLTEGALPGARDMYIHWAQEMYDQAAVVREIVKWDYELRNRQQLETVVDRAISLAMSEPRGPVYLSLPREIIAEPLQEFSFKSATRAPTATPPRADAAAIDEAARLLGRARNPLIITTNAGRYPAAVSALADFADRFAIPVVQHRPRYLALPSGHAMNLGYEPASELRAADAILVLESDVPWIPSLTAPEPGSVVIHMGLDPLFSRYPIRGFNADLTITGHIPTALPELRSALADRSDYALVEERRRNIAVRRSALLAESAKLREACAKDRPIHPAWVSHCIDRAKSDETIIVNEYTLLLDHCGFSRPGTFFGSSSGSGLGWGIGAALGAKLASPEQPVIAVLGDGAYIFGNPVAAHHASTLHDLPVLFVIMNNAMWDGVRQAAFGMYPNGAARKSNKVPFVHLDKLPAFEQVCIAAGGYGERVEDPADLPNALERALRVVRYERRQALLNVICRQA